MKIMIIDNNRLFREGLVSLLVSQSDMEVAGESDVSEEAIQKAKLKDFSGVNTLLALLEAPFDEHPGFEAYAGFPPDWASNIEISCSS